MPGGDGTGPMGMGPMTGRAAGYCAGYSVPGYMNPYGGRGWGMGFGRGRGYWGWGRGGGRGWRNQYWATGLTGWQRFGLGSFPAAAMPPQYAWAEPTAEQRRSFLENQMQVLQDQMEAVKQSLADLAEKEDEK